jgi:hypothetical protein
MIASRRLTARLTRTLEAKAGQAGADVTDRVPPRRTGRRRLLLPAAAVAVVAALGAGTIALQRTRDETPVSTVTLGDPPDGWLVPTWVPEGMELWGVESSSSSGPGGFGEAGTIPQLFGDPDGGRAIYITSFRYDLRPGTAEQVTVRGQVGQAGRGWDVEETDVGDAITWNERGATVTALYRGVTRNEAIAALDSLEWRSDDPADGFAPPSGGSWPLRGEVGSHGPVGRDAVLLYGDGRPELWIHTSSSSAVSAEYLDAWYEQGPEAGDGERPLRSYDEDGHELTVLWPDGRSITISPTGGTQAQLPSLATLDRIADSLTVASDADLAALRDTAGANIEALPVLASAGTRIGTVDVHGDGELLQLCLRSPSAPGSSCNTDPASGGTSPDGTAIATAEWTIDGAWYVVVASTGAEPEIVGGRDPRGSPDAGELPAETTTAGEWTVRLVQPAPDIQMVCTSSGGAVSCNHHRPG